MLNVPVFFQPKDKPYCGLHAARMALSYYGVNLTEKEILKEMGEDMDNKDGIEITALGTSMLKQGFDVVAYYFPSFFPPSILSASMYEEDERLEKWINSPSRDVVIQKRKSELKSFVLSGGILSPRPVSFETIDKEVSGKHPVILNLNVAPLYGLKRKYAGHFVVVRGMNESVITVNDPSTKRGGKVTYPLERVMHACYIWKSAALFIWKRD